MNELFDMNDAPRWLGLRVVIDLQIRRGDDEPLEDKRILGTIEMVSEGAGIVVRLDGGSEYHLPPDFSAFDTVADPDNPAEMLRRIKQVLHRPPPEMEVPPVDQLPNRNPMLLKDEHGEYRSPEVS